MSIEGSGPELLIVRLLLFISSFMAIIIESSPLPSSGVINVGDDTKDGSIPPATKIPTTVSPAPAALAIQIPLDHIFSPKIIPANRPIQSRFIHPSATIRRKYAQDRKSVV